MTTTALAAFGPLRNSWTVTAPTVCADCLHAAYANALTAQDTATSAFTVRHGDHSARVALTR